MSERTAKRTIARRVARHRGAVARFAVVVLLLLAAGLAPLLAPSAPGAQALDSGLSGPSRSHWLGQDRLGRDLLSRLIHGARVSVAVGLGTVSLSLAIGLLVRSAAGGTPGSSGGKFSKSERWSSSSRQGRSAPLPRGSSGSTSSRTRSRPSSSGPPSGPRGGAGGGGGGGVLGRGGG